MKIIPSVLLLVFLTSAAFSQTNAPAKNPDPAALAFRQSQMKAPIGQDYYKLTNADSIFQAVGIDRPHGACILTFWFASCPPCIAEFPDLVRLSQRYPAEKFTIISLTFEEESVINDFQQKYNLPFTPKHISTEVCSKLALGTGFPRNIILDANGIIALASLGGSGDPQQSSRQFEEEIIPVIENILKQGLHTKASSK